jgi:hypothetical protein
MSCSRGLIGFTLKDRCVGSAAGECSLAQVLVACGHWFVSYETDDQFFTWLPAKRETISQLSNWVWIKA